MLRRLLQLGIALGLILAALAAYALYSVRQAPLDVLAEARALHALQIEARKVQVAPGVQLYVVLAGPEKGPPVVLLHGFPEFWYGYARVIAPLAAAGFRVIVPDQRGYDLSDKPPHVEDYRIEQLAEDVVALAHELGHERFDLVGHDWGGAVAWSVVTRHPDRVAHLAMFNSPHPLAWSDLREQDPDIGKGITYRDLFQIPVVPELATRFRNWRVLAGALVGSSRPGTFPDDELLLYRQAWAQPGAIHAMIEWYRAARRFPAGFAKQPGSEIQVPVRIVWGMKDAFFDPRLPKLTLQHCPNGTLTEVADAGHWILHEEPDLAAREMIALFRSPARAAAASGAAD